jgi:hypothetical protein
MCRRTVFVAVAMFLVAAFLWSGRVGMASDPPKSPVRWDSASPPLPTDHTRALEVVRAYSRRADLNGATAAFVTFHDDSPLGERDGSKPCWKVTVPDIVVEHHDGRRSQPFALHFMVDVQEDRVLAVFTDYREERVLQPHEYWDTERMVAKNGWTVAPLSQAPRLTAEGVLGIVWNGWGIDPSEVGQVVLRPRDVAVRFPEEMRDGKRVSVHSPGPYWIVQAIGVTGLERLPGQYVPDVLTLVDDTEGVSFELSASPVARGTGER